MINPPNVNIYENYVNYVADATLSQGYTEGKSRKQNKLELNRFCRKLDIKCIRLQSRNSDYDIYCVRALTIGSNFAASIKIKLPFVRIPSSWNARLESE